MIRTRATRDGIRGDGTPSDGHVVQWVSLIGRWAVPSIHRPTHGARLIVYLESGLDAEGYRDILDGEYDARLLLLAETLPPDAIVRWDHEMSSPPNEWRTWGGVPPELYVEVWRHVSRKLDRSMFWCPSGHRVNADYFPGRDWVDFVGFTYYELGRRPKRTGQRIPASTQWRKPLSQVRALAPGVPILIGETGTLDDDTGDRLPWLRSVKRVKGLWGVIYFDLDMTTAEGRDWSMSGQMLTEWRR